MPGAIVMKLKCIKTLFAILMILPNHGFSAQLTLEDFLVQVQKQNQAVVANKLVAEAGEEREAEGNLIFRPGLFAQAQTMIDKKPTSNPTIQGDRIDSGYGTVGLTQNFTFGLKGQLSYTLYHTKIYNAGRNFVPLVDFNDGIAKLELSQSLWRNWKGLEQNAQSDLMSTQAKIAKHNANFTVQSMLVTAESIYWSLSQSKKVIQVQKDNLERAQYLRTWNSRRVNNGLSERSDFLQADSNLKLREYELQNALQQQNLLQRTFNSIVL